MSLPLLRLCSGLRFRLQSFSFQSLRFSSLPGLLGQTTPFLRLSRGSLQFLFLLPPVFSNPPLDVRLKPFQSPLQLRCPESQRLLVVTIPNQ